MGNPSLTGRKRSRATKNKIRKAKLGAKNAFFGQHHSDEAKQASREASLRYWAKKKLEKT